MCARARAWCGLLIHTEHSQRSPRHTGGKKCDWDQQEPPSEHAWIKDIHSDFECCELVRRKFSDVPNFGHNWQPLHINLAYYVPQAFTAQQPTT